METQPAGYIEAKEAAVFWKVDVPRARAILRAGKVKGACKDDRDRWMVPADNKGRPPKIKPGTRGPKGRWHKPSRRTAPTVIVVNRHRIAKNKKNRQENNGKPCKPVLSVKEGSQSPIYGYEVQIDGPCKLIYHPDKPLNCGATVSLRVDPHIEVLCQELIAEFKPRVLEIG